MFPVQVFSICPKQLSKKKMLLNKFNLKNKFLWLIIWLWVELYWEHQKSLISDFSYLTTVQLTNLHNDTTLLAVKSAPVDAISTRLRS